MLDDNKALVRRLFDEVFSAENLAAADEIMAKDYIEHAVAPFGSDEPGRVFRGTGPPVRRSSPPSAEQASNLRSDPPGLYEGKV